MKMLPRTFIQLFKHTVCVLCLFLPQLGFSADQSDRMLWPELTPLQLALRGGLKEAWGKEERIEIRSINRVVVDKSEEAFLVAAWLPDRGRNFSAATFLYRPAVKQAKQLDFHNVVAIPYTSHFYGKFVILENYGSGSGVQDFTHALVRFNGWRVEVLHKADFGDNLGSCELISISGREPCIQTKATFVLLDGFKFDQLILVESLTKTTGATFETLRASTTIRHFHWMKDRFIPIFESK
jgi:hypothetical protein